MLHIAIIVRNRTTSGELEATVLSSSTSAMKVEGERTHYNHFPYYLKQTKNKNKQKALR